MVDSPRDEPTFPTGYSGAFAINNDGDVVGQSGGAGGSSAVIWPGGGAPTDLGSLPAEAYSYAVDISDSGWIVGIASDTGQSWYIDPDVGTVTVMDPVAGATITQVRAVNDAGVAVGRVYVDSVFVPFIWNVDDGMTLLPEPPGEGGFEPTQIKDAALPHGLSDTGWVVGFVDNTGSDSRVSAAWELTTGDSIVFEVFNDAARRSTADTAGPDADPDAQVPGGATGSGESELHRLRSGHTAYSQIASASLRLLRAVSWGDVSGQ